MCHQLIKLSFFFFSSISERSETFNFWTFWTLRISNLKNNFFPSSLKPWVPRLSLGERFYSHIDMLKHLEIGVYNGNAHRPLAAAVLEVIVIMALNKNCQLQIIFRDVPMSSVTGEIKGDIWTGQAACLTGRTRAAAEKKDKSIFCLRRKTFVRSLDQWLRVPKRQMQLPRQSNERIFISSAHFNMSDALLLQELFQAVVFLFLACKKTWSCCFNISLANADPLVITWWAVADSF